MKEPDIEVRGFVESIGDDHFVGRVTCLQEIVKVSFDYLPDDLENTEIKERISVGDFFVIKENSGDIQIEFLKEFWTKEELEKAKKKSEVLYEDLFGNK